MTKLPEVKHELSIAEKMMIVRSHHYFVKEKDEGRSKMQRKVREHIAECISVSQSTVACVIAQWNRQRDPGFLAEPSPRGKPPLPYSASLVTNIRDIVYERNRKVLPTTVSIITEEIEKRTDEKFTRRTVSRVMRRNKFRFRRGKLRHYSVDDIDIVAYRDWYLRSKCNNYDRKGNSKLPEIHLDESYCSFNHVAIIPIDDDDDDLRSCSEESE